LPEVWKTFAGKDEYFAESLATEGFIHCSYESQLAGVFGRYYSGVEKVILLEIDPELLTSELRVEASTNEELYPHIYGPINNGAVVSVMEHELS